MRDVYPRNAEQANFRLFCPDETNSNRLGDVFEVENRCFVAPILAGDDHVSPDGRVMEVLSEHNCEGWLEGYVLTGRHGLFATYEAFAMVVRVDDRPAREVARRGARACLAHAGPVAQHPADFNLLAQRPQRLQPSGARLDRHVLSKKGTVARIYLPPDANCLLSVADHCFRSRNYVNLIVIDKQPQLQWLDLPRSRRAKRGAGALSEHWEWAGTTAVPSQTWFSACAGDTATPWRPLPQLLGRLRKLPESYRFRSSMSSTLMALGRPSTHPHGMDRQRFARAVYVGRQVVFAFHGYPGAADHSPWPGAIPAYFMCGATGRRARRRLRSTWSC